MTKAKQCYLVDFRDTEIDSLCGMRTWYSRFQDGRGIIRKEDILLNDLTQKFHEDLRVVASMPDIRIEAIRELVDDILKPLTTEDKQDTVKMELLYRRLGWMIAFALFKEPQIREHYQTIETQPDVVLDREGLWVIAHPDRLLKNKHSGEFNYREYEIMPPGLTHNNWMQGWHYNMRLHLGMAAVGEDIHAKIDWGHVMGLSEGYKSILDGRLVHPYVWAYRDKHGAWANGMRSDGGDWKPAPVWEFEAGLVEWVRMCGATMAESQFHLSPPVSLNGPMLNGWVARTLHREREVSAFSQVCHSNVFQRVNHFPREHTSCRPNHGPACPFLKVCWTPALVHMPCKSGEFVHVPQGAHAGEFKVGEVVS